MSDLEMTKEELMGKMQSMAIELQQLQEELQKEKHTTTALAETIVRLSMRLTGVN